MADNQNPRLEIHDLEAEESLEKGELAGVKGGLMPEPWVPPDPDRKRSRLIRLL